MKKIISNITGQPLTTLLGVAVILAALAVEASRATPDWQGVAVAVAAGLSLIALARDGVGGGGQR